MKDLGDLNFISSWESKPNSTALVLTQTKYTLDLLTRTHMQDSKPCPFIILKEILLHLLGFG